MNDHDTQQPTPHDPGEEPHALWALLKPVGLHDIVWDASEPQDEKPGPV